MLHSLIKGMQRCHSSSALLGEWTVGPVAGPYHSSPCLPRAGRDMGDATPPQLANQEGTWTQHFGFCAADRDGHAQTRS